MATKEENKAVHMTKAEDAFVVQLAKVSGRKASQIIHDCITVAAFQVPEYEKRLAATRLAHAISLVTDSQKSVQTVDFLNPERSESANDESQHTRFSRLMDNAQRPEVLHG